MDLLKIHRGPRGLENFIPVEKCQLELEKTERVQNERRMLDHQNAISTKQAGKTTQLQACYIP